MDAITTTLTSSIGVIQSEGLDVILAVLPIALVIFGSVVVIAVGIKVFKKVRHSFFVSMRD
jgi:hypothetical protein